MVADDRSSAKTKPSWFAEEQDDGEHHERQVPALDPQGPLPGKHDREENERGQRVADGRVRERLEAVIEDVLRGREVQGPQADGDEQHRVCHRAPAHPSDPSD